MSRYFTKNKKFLKNIAKNIKKDLTKVNFNVIIICRVKMAFLSVPKSTAIIASLK